MTGWWCNNHLEKWWSSSMGRIIPYMKCKIIQPCLKPATRSSYWGITISGPPPNSWPTTTHSFINHNRPVQPLHEGSCFSSRPQLAGCAPRCAPRGKRTRRIVALNSWVCNSCHYKSTLKQCFFSQLQLLVGIEPWRVVNGYSKCAVLNNRKWWLNLT